MDLNRSAWKLIIAALRFAAMQHEQLSRMSSTGGKHLDASQQYDFACKCGTLSDEIDKRIFGRSPRRPLIIKPH